MGHMAHVSGLSDGGNRGIHIGKEPYVGGNARHGAGRRMEE